MVVEVIVVKDVGLVKIHWSPAVPVDGILNLKLGGKGGVRLPF